MKASVLFEMVPEYRLPFYEGVHEVLQQRNIDFQLLHGTRSGANRRRNDESHISWAEKIRQSTIPVGSKTFLWQHFGSKLTDTNVIITENAFRILSNIKLVAMCKKRNIPLVWWGMGRNMQFSDRAWRNKMKKMLIKWADYHFPYTKGTADYLVSRGVSADRIFVIPNTIDVESIRKIRSTIAASDVDEARKRYGVAKAPTAIFCGGMYRGKGLKRILDISMIVRKEIPDFQLILVGDGVDADLARSTADSHEWIIFTGRQSGLEKALLFEMSDMFLLPQSVGLNAVDSFAYEVPMVGGPDASGPELEYITHDVNGVVLNGDNNMFANKIVYLLKNSKQLEKLKKNCAKAADGLQMSVMVNSFTDAVSSILERSTVS